MPSEKQKSQSEKFKETACELECNEDEKVFEDKLRRLAKSQKKDKPAD